MIKKLYIVLAFSAFLLFSACSVKKDSIKNRAYHNMTSWFNTLFNGQMAMEEKLQELKLAHKDDYFEVLPVSPYGEFKVNNNPTPAALPEINNSKSGKGPSLMGAVESGNLLSNETSSKTGFEKAEEKALKAINNHSMVIKGKERNKLVSRAYLMLGESRYYLGKPFQAMDALQYVENLPFAKHKQEAKYFAALSQIQTGNKFAAEDILEKMETNKDMGKQQKADVAKNLGWMYFQQNDYEKAVESLDKAIDFTKDKDEEARLNFIQGQILSKMGKYDDANVKFSRAYKLKPGFEMEARAQTAIASNFDPLSNNYIDYKSKLLKAYNTGTYESYRNEFLYALGELELKRDSLGLAEKAFIKSLKEKPSEPRYKAETFASLGDIKFKKSDYIYAGAYYDSAVTAIPEGKRKVELTKFRDDLKNVIDKHYLVLRNDSLLNLAAMPIEERTQFFEKYIADLKVKDEARRAKEAQETTQFLTQSKASSFESSFGDADSKFYFYSNTAKSNGETEFRRIWGNIQLKDNWRSSMSGGSIEEQKTEMTGIIADTDPRRYDIEYYLEQMKTDPITLNELKVARDTTELSLGIDYFEKFNDYRLATKTVEHLVSSPPKDENVMMAAIYNLYRFNKEKNPILAEQFKNRILNEYPTSTYAGFILNPEIDYSEENNPEVLALYDDTYKGYKDGDYECVRRNSEIAFAEHPLAKITPKFALLYAYAEGADYGRDALIEALERVTILYSGTEEAKHAQDLIDELMGKKKPKPSVQQVEGDDSGMTEEAIMKMQEEEAAKDSKNRKSNIPPAQNKTIPKSSNKTQPKDPANPNVFESGEGFSPLKR